MGIERELTQFLEGQLKPGGNKARNIEIVKFYYGLSDSPWPTLEDTASRFAVGTRERIRQLLNSNFREHVRTDSLPSLRSIVQIFNSKDFWLSNELEEQLQLSGLIEEATHLKGILNLLDDVKIDYGFALYTPELKAASRETLARNKNIFLIKTSRIDELTQALKEAKRLPGLLGVANLKYIKEKLGESYSIVCSLIESLPEAWVQVNGQDYWYIFENRDNKIINYTEKVFSVIEQCDAAHLAEAYANAMPGRTHGHEYPPAEIIEDYLRSSIHTVNTDSGLRFVGETTELNQIEKDLISFFNVHREATSKALDTYLAKKGHKEARRKQAIHYSPLVFVDKTAGRRNYVYRLIGEQSSGVDYDAEADRYESYLRRLRALLKSGTDQTREQAGRKEQQILQEWLFKDKEHEKCALCGQEFSVSTLVAAHKKPRSVCNDAERLDPNIVMPLCLMGCDYLYENMYIYIEGDEIRRGQTFNSPRAESAFIDNLVGRKVSPKWLSGNQSYFRSPSNRQESQNR